MSSAVRGTVGNLPLDLTSFVGRRREVAEAKRLLSGSRLVTLSGIGGVGKTRLALRVAEDSRRAFEDGAWLVELGELHDPELLAETVVSALGLREQSAHPPRALLEDYLVSRHLLLVLDNCEHLIGAVAALTEGLLKACPKLTILATSREPLGIGGEATLRVPPLGVPDPDRPSSLEALPRYDAVSLFAERAGAVVPGFGLTADNQVAVTRICQRLDGLPLPIELAAARLRAMSVQQILQRLTDRLRLLTRGSRGAPERQQTLRLSIDWSYELCTEEERQLWSRLTVFAGSFELDAAEGICAGDLAPDDLLDVVMSLVDKSILIREESGAVVRYRLLETLRDYGREKLRETGDYTVRRRRHRDWYEQLALRAEAEWIGARQLEWIARLDREQSNLRDALTFCLTEPGEGDSGVRIADALYPFWLSRGQLSEGRHWLDRVLACSGGQPNPKRVAALCDDTVLAVMQGDLRAGTAQTYEARALAEQLGSDVTRALVDSASGYLDIFSGDLPRAVLSLEAALEVFRAENDPLRRVSSLLGVALASGLRGDTRRAIACHEEVLELTESRGESMFRAYSLCMLGLAVWQEGDPVRGTRLLEEGLRLTRLMDDPLTAATSLEALAWIAAERHESERAAVLMGASESVGQASGIKAVIIPGLLSYQKRRRKQARAALGAPRYEAALQEGRELSVDDAVAYALGEHRLPAATPSTIRPSRNLAAPGVHLTKREQQVSELVAEGLTNKAIAARLVISQRTAQGHVEHVLAKLGFTSRAQIAAWVVERNQDRGT
ncbi:ATP-binding protein [Rhodococcus sp. NPDC127528]|uniref:ATP-binding protein n=1 Tax=unclassified Rhodococcus (in: high G+C Gram-positive bacteria) TaxID=192944 RepID=UPI0036408F7C